MTLDHIPFELDASGDATPMLDQLRFAEALMAETDLNETERRVGFLLARWFRHGDGCTIVGLPKIAAALTITVRTVIRAIEGLEVKGWFLIQRNRGRGNANVYIPNGEKVSSASPFSDAVRRNAHSKNVTAAARKGDTGGAKRCQPRHEKVTPASPTRESFRLSESGDYYRASLGSEAHTCGFADADFADIGRRAADQQPCATSNPHMTDEEFEQRRAKILRELAAIPAARPRTLQWYTPCLAEIPRGPRPSGFGPWLEQEGTARGIPRQYIADALAIPVAALQAMIGGRVQWSTQQCRRAEAALAKFELGYPPRTRHPS